MDDLPPFLRLPPELHLEIFEILDFPTLKAASALTRALRPLALPFIARQTLRCTLLLRLTTTADVLVRPMFAVHHSSKFPDLPRVCEKYTRIVFRFIAFTDAENWPHRNPPGKVGRYFPIDLICQFKNLQEMVLDLREVADEAILGAMGCRDEEGSGSDKARQHFHNLVTEMRVDMTYYVSRRRGGISVITLTRHFTNNQCVRKPLRMKWARK
ncbi:hypothetical protein BJ508DRAFT_31481 [Ascobolus immersus RN42]|uniref:F-box domain-containing protein n=1 Tax=Ascobolus immersus RN42 TaxID=1160509 RepID=A0A3N4ISE5_ASCIM|nr:hypothetical protein BJ508DRAFT_31481 [Ascobolus immersus RN42]